ncbi:hypothetical protein V2O64_20365 [Verrucomicrobiaceae bacterium 227]
MKNQLTLFVGLTALMMPLGFATPPNLAEPVTEKKEAVATPAKVSPWDKDDGEWITIAGKITVAGVNKFTLDYGKGAVVVEMDDYDRELEGFHLKVDDKVIVVGRVDADTGQKRSIEAASVYVENINKSFFASADDEEEVIAKLRKASANGTGLALTGKVIFIADDLMTIDNGYQVFDVKTSLLTEKPFDKEGLLQLEVGDKVTAYGTITDGFVEGRMLVASQVIKR